MLEGFGMGTFEMEGRILVLLGRRFACMEVEAVIVCCFNMDVVIWSLAFLWRVGYEV